MTPKHDLHELIHSLTEAEAAAFRKEILKREGQHVYLQIFDAILEMTEYSEDKIKKLFQGKKTLNNFSIAKNNLYEKVLEVLCFQPHNQNIETKFDRFKQQIAILIRKSLYKQALERVEKAIRLAEKMEVFKRVLELHDLKREIGRNFLTPQAYLDLLRDLRNEGNWIKEADENLDRYREIFDTASIAQKFPRNVRNAMINSLLGHEIMQDVSECRSISAQIFFFRIWNHLYLVQGRTNGWQFFTDKLIHLLEKNPMLLADPGKFLLYVNTISNIGLNSLASGEYATAMEAAEKLHTVRKELKTGENEALIFSRYWKLQLLYCQKKLDERNGLIAVERIEHGLRKFRGKLSKNDVMELIHHVSIFLLTMERPSEAIRWILPQRDEKFGATRPDLHYFAWLIVLVAHYNMGHIDVVDQQLAGTLRYLKEHRRNNPYFKVVLGFFKKVVNARTGKDVHDLLTALQGDIEHMMRQGGDSNVLEYFNFIAWAEAQKRGIPMKEALKNWKADFLEVPS